MLKQLQSHIIIGIVGMLLLCAVAWRATSQYDEAVDLYRASAESDAKIAAKSLESALIQVYQNIRTIGYLPSVRGIDRHGTNLNADGLQSIQQIYNNLASSVAVSEVYVVPESLNPDAIDPVTGEKEVPILMFDQLIVGGAGESGEGERDASLPVEEESEEYKLLVEQIATLRSGFPSNRNIKGLSVPFIGGRDVITCDNSEFDATRKDADRKGLMLSVPFYGLANEFKGTITAVVRNNALRDLLPQSHYALVKTDDHLLIASKDDAQVQASKAYAQKAVADDALVFSKVIDLKVPVVGEAWKLWVGLPDAQLLESAQIKGIFHFQQIASLFIVIIAAVAGWIVEFLAKQRFARRIQLQREEQERSAHEERMEQQRLQLQKEAEQQRREAMLKMADNFEATVHGVVSEVISCATQLQSGVESVRQIVGVTRTSAVTMAQMAGVTAETSSDVAAAAEELTMSIQEINMQTSRAGDVVYHASSKALEARKVIDQLMQVSTKVVDIVDVIVQFAEQINLLALNATIESARAGEAGRGFAVVASAVKTLANQVAKASDEISAQVHSMQKVTEKSINVVTDVVDIIKEIEETSTAVAAAMEEQSSVTSDIARNITKTAASSQEIARNVSTVESGAEKTADTLQDVLQSSFTLGKQSRILNEKVQVFLNSIRNG